MTKNENDFKKSPSRSDASLLQKELLEKVKPNTKPSDIKKLKRSKSADDVPSAPPLPQSSPLNRSKSTEPNQSFTDTKYPYTTLIAQQEELEVLRKETEAKSTTISLLRKKIEELENSLNSLTKERQELEKHPPTLLLEEQLKEKQLEIENLRQQLETKPLANSELDQALIARHKNLKDWFTKYQQKKVLEQELAENINEASTELITQDQTISTLRTENRKLKQTNSSLQKDLDLAQRAVAWRQNPLSPLPSNSPWTLYTLTFCLVGAVLYLTIR